MGTIIIIAAMLLGGASPLNAPPAAAGLKTRWSDSVSPETAHREHPRPQMVRERWASLNGLWDYAIRPRGDAAPDRWDGSILVPYCVESALSGVGRSVSPQERLWYRRPFEAPAAPPGWRMLLHFGAVDHHAEIWVNGVCVGEHWGGYDPFTLDITMALAERDAHEVVVGVWDPTDSGPQPRGKQVAAPGGIWYTAVTGIWQSVWLEPVPPASIERLRLESDTEAGTMSVAAGLRGAAPGDMIVATVSSGGREVASARGPADAAVAVAIPQARLWSPENPFLYELAVRLERGSRAIDEVQSYFGMRRVAVARDEDGHLRLFLNGRSLFQLGMLDQGWWPDGLYTAPTDEALRYDIEAARRMGFNLLRKHVKVEPARWYYHCDRLGMLVWQDMPSGEESIGPSQADLVRRAESADTFRREYRAMIESLRNHPCIVSWVPFNEGWGQFDTAKIAQWTKELDGSRIVNAASGWTDRGVGDVHDVHSYPSPALPAPEEKRAAVLGEFGGLGLPLPGHLWREDGSWGYATYRSRDELEAAYRDLAAQLRPLIAGGLAAAVYTQLSDVEIEVNGLLTYDRAEFKIDPDRLRAIHQPLFEPPPRLGVLLETSERAPQTWRTTTVAPPPGWEQPGFDDRGWTTAPGGFGTQGTPGALVRSTWSTGEIWLRRTFTLPQRHGGEVWLRVHHDEDAEIFFNGQRVASLRGYTTAYVLRPLDAETARLLHAGENVIAVHCRQTTGGQYIDVGLVEAADGE